jgi:hypothetical protein
VISFTLRANLSPEKNQRDALDGRFGGLQRHYGRCGKDKIAFTIQKINHSIIIIISAKLHFVNITGVNV